MSHVRRQIRDAARARLTGLATTGDRVFQHPHALAEQDLPALRVTTMNENAEREGDAGCGILVRTVELVVEAWATGGDDLWDRLDAMAVEIEQAIGADDTLGGLAEETILDTTETTIDGERDRRAGRITLTFAVRVSTPAADPTRAL